MQIIENLEIIKHGYQGVGIGFYNNKKVFVPLSVTGDLLKVKITKENSKFIEAEIIEIIQSSKNRITPECKYFSICGGCDLQHVSNDLYKSIKLQQVTECLSRAGFNFTNIKFIEVPNKSRRKARFHNNNGKIGFYKKNSKEVVEIESCEILNDEVLKELFKIRKQRINSGEIDITLTDNDYITIGDYKIKYNDYFLQSSDETNNIIADLIKPSLQNSFKIIDLFAGIGAYGFLLHKYVKFIQAIEGENKVVEPFKEAVENYNINNLELQIQDLFKKPINTSELNSYDAIIINPPKNGAEPQFEEIAKSDVNNVFVASCNPVTLERDLKYLSKAGFKLVECALIDQFKWSYHSEVYAYLTKDF